MKPIYPMVTVAKRAQPFVRGLRKRANQHVRRTRKRGAALWAAVESLWLRFEDEATSCPACVSSELALLDVLRVRGDLTGRRVALLTGCEACGLVFTNPLPQAERVADYYGEAGPWGTPRTPRRAPSTPHAAPDPPPSKRQVLLDALQPFVPVHVPPPGVKAIDFGCGEGKLLNSLQDAGWETYGVEPSTSVAFERHRRLDVPPADGSFDLAILHHVLEHMPNPLDVLRQLAGSLREGGGLFISVPRFDRIAQHGDFRYCINGVNHPVAFTEASLRSLLARAGFEIAARLDSAELDRALTKGQPLRLRLVARRTAARPAVPVAPLAAAREALAAYRRTHVPFPARAAHVLPLRLRGGWLQWTLTR